MQRFGCLEYQTNDAQRGHLIRPFGAPSPQGEGKRASWGRFSRHTRKTRLPRRACTLLAMTLFECVSLCVIARSEAARQSGPHMQRATGTVLLIDFCAEKCVRSIPIPAMAQTGNENAIVVKLYSTFKFYISTQNVSITQGI